MITRFSVDYRPLYFLASLGAGGLAVSFFMYLMFLVPHPHSPVPRLEDVQAAYASGGLLVDVLISLALLGIAGFVLLHLDTLVANLRAFAALRRDAAYETLRSSNAEVQLMAIPLTLAMTVNVLFIVGALAVPGLWDVVEYLFPFALLAFASIGGMAFFLFGRYLTRLLTERGFNHADNNHFSQVLPSFAFAMVAVGFSASAAMSHHPATSTLGLIGAFVFTAAAAAWMFLKLPLAFASMLRDGMAVEAGPTLWMGIPIFTLFGITFHRSYAGISHNITGTEMVPAVALVVLGLLVAAQLVMGAFGWMVMRRQGYFETYVRGAGRSIPAYGLVCPGVALSVLGMFFIHWGLVSNGIVERFSAVHLGLLALNGLLQAVTILTLVRLNRKLFGRGAVAEQATADEEEVLPARVPA